MIFIPSIIPIQGHIYSHISMSSGITLLPQPMSNMILIFLYKIPQIKHWKSACWLDSPCTSLFSLIHEAFSSSLCWDEHLCALNLSSSSYFLFPLGFTLSCNYLFRGLLLLLLDSYQIYRLYNKWLTLKISHSPWLLAIYACWVTWGTIDWIDSWRGLWTAQSWTSVVSPYLPYEI